MKDSQEEKYVGDIITGDGKNDKNIQSRRSKGYGIAGDILAILAEVPFGIYKIEAGITMRNSMLINCMLSNSEVWYGITENEKNMLEEVDLYLMRKILNAHSKTPKEMIYLETGILPIRYIIKQRRISYLNHILSRNDAELIKRVYLAQKRKPIKNDWYLTVQNDIKDLNLNLSEDIIGKTKKAKFKILLKQKVTNASFEYLNNIKETHSKVKNIMYKKLEIQPYMKSNKFTIKEKQFLFKLRTRMTYVKSNFSSMYSDLNCDLCEKECLQSDIHLLDCTFMLEKCHELNDNNFIEYEDIFKECHEQLKIVRMFIALFEIKTKHEDNQLEEDITS